MQGKTVNSAIFLLVTGNLLAIFSDVLIKWASRDELAIFQFVAVRLIFTVLLLTPFLRRVDWDNLWQGSRVHLVRAHVGLGGIICMVVALGALPLATANAIFYAAPVLVMFISVVFFREQLTKTSLFAVVGGLIGVMIILRPTQMNLAGLAALGLAVALAISAVLVMFISVVFFREQLTKTSLFAVVGGLIGVMIILRPTQMNLAGLAALGLAVALAISAVLVRKLPRDQPVTHSLLLNYMFSLPAALLLALIEGAPVDFVSMGAAFGSALFVLGYNMTVIMAYKHVDANKVTASEYTGILWAFILGWLFFAEVPDAWFWVGTTLIVVPLLFQALQSVRPASRRRLPVQVGGSRRATDRLAGRYRVRNAAGPQGAGGHVDDESPGPAP